MVQLKRNDLIIEIVQGNITQMDTDAITNAANSALILGSGVAGAIDRAGGPSIQQECDQIGHCRVGSAVITGAGNMKARYVIHAVGPRMGEGDEDNKLASAFRSTLRIAEENHINSVALPAISTGIFGFPIERCAEIMRRELKAFADSDRSHTQRVVVCLYDKQAYDTFVDEFEARWSM
jgi:O-acetyl-ADP-ribose deacetylase (regulator of RNase III)